MAPRSAVDPLELALLRADHRIGEGEAVVRRLTHLLNTIAPDALGVPEMRLQLALFLDTLHTMKVARSTMERHRALMLLSG
ncbi:hypothetical protein [Roseomonas elaeocarpi]|uniref:Uncharacterized protein n=1 Tax=Roseomonas elaeocarpi TaxID=907779 RepID=A0ABV6JQT8_9PROT